MKLWQLYKLLVKNLGESKQKVNGSEKFIAKLQKILKILLCCLKLPGKNKKVYLMKLNS